mmetsp:Transcript_88714/g.284816  ORF Transcript_88714/g.284816 Transcript_88714/m.284816 type:complete len:274 (-) Transcript_88714:124-945(-)
MADKFKMSDGSHGMLKGQADPNNMPRRSCHDTEHERQAVRPRPQKTHADSTGFTSQVADIATTDIMEQAIQDKLTQTMEHAIEDGWNARLEDEKNNEDRYISQAELDEKQDSKNVDDDDLEVLRARRRQQMKDAHDKKLKYQALGHGGYDDIEEEAFLKTVTASERAVVHFHHKMFEKCKVMDMHLAKCARKFFGTRFVRLDAEKAPFFVEKLMIRTLPCVIVFSDGVAVGRQVGFEGLSLEGDFETIQLACRLKEMKGIEEDLGPEDDVQWS